MFEEEDFQPLVYGFRLASEVTEQKALALIKESEEDVIKKIKSSTISESSEDTREVKVRIWNVSDQALGLLNNFVLFVIGVECTTYPIKIFPTLLSVVIKV